ncbi:GMC oxidoreductase [Agromyces sp. G08B096]|uniref:Cholesterol oxidase n=1 Tax=Agromyces sp. G08B096 TaxID=3156399 RepID=A0AAU7W725_9MICO
MSGRDGEPVDAIVVGSGFGGAVAAARLAQAGLEVLVLERGRRFRPDDFPREPRLDAGWLWNLEHGLYDVRWLDRMVSVQAAGWGGGSLVYANVFARAAQAVFDDERWPRTLRRDALDPYYDLAAHMLEVAPVAADPDRGDLPARAHGIERLAERIGRPEGTIRPNLAVRFSAEPDVPVPNRHGVAQLGCAFCGECVIGCRRGAKRSLDLTYLAVAEQHGAAAVTGAEVERIEPDAGGYRVTWRELGSGTTRSRRARTVVLAAGAVGTTELLLRQRDVLGTLPALSDRLGEHFSGNGDALTFLRRTSPGLEAGRGPTITTSTVLDVEERGEPVWFQVQDGAIPAPLSALLAEIARDAVPWRRRTGPARRPSARRGDRAPRAAATARPRRDTLALLLMGRDAATGRIGLDRRHRATVSWDARAHRRLTRAQARVGGFVARHLGGRPMAVPTWSLLRTPITVHPLGGAPIGADADDGVIDEFGRVHGYPGLLVVDGAAVPTATGANPSATILALAERSIEHAVRTLTGDADWRAPEWDDVEPMPAPEDAAVAAMARERRTREGDGVRFAERLNGSLSVDGEERRAGLRLTAELPGWHRFRAARRHPLTVTGLLDVDGLATRQPVRGRLELFPDGERELMRYVLDARADDGRPLRLVGAKLPRGPLSPVAALTRLQLVIGDADGALGAGELRIGTVDLVRLASSLRGVGFTTARRLRVLARFAGFFGAGAVRAIRPPRPPRPPRPHDPTASAAAA